MSTMRTKTNTDCNSDEGDGGTVIPSKPKRPFTCYNIFAQLERHYILQMNQKTCQPDLKDDSIDQNAAERPKKYREIVLPVNWYVVGVNRKKRQDRKKHGVISFNDLSKAIAQSWKEVDDETKLFCMNLAQKEYERYQEVIAQYKSKYGKDDVKNLKRKQSGKSDSDPDCPRKRKRQDESVNDNDDSSSDDEDDSAITDENQSGNLMQRCKDDSHEIEVQQNVNTTKSYLSDISISSFDDDSNILTGAEEANAFKDRL